MFQEIIKPLLALPWYKGYPLIILLSESTIWIILFLLLALQMIKLFIFDLPKAVPVNRKKTDPGTPLKNPEKLLIPESLANE